MDKHCGQTKPVGDRQLQTEQAHDWPPVEIVIAIWRKKSSLHRLSKQHGYKNAGLRLALRNPWPKAERIIADFLGVAPNEIWPSRYHADGTSTRRPRGNPNWVSRPLHQRTHDARRAVPGHVKKSRAI